MHVVMVEIEQGREFFEQMVNVYQINLEIKHYGCMVDMFGRVGMLEEAEKMAMKIPTEMINVIIWRTLLGACSYHGNAEMSERVMKKIFELERDYSGDYVLLSNTFSGAGRFDDAEMIRKIMDERNVSKVPGLSLSLANYSGTVFGETWTAPLKQWMGKISFLCVQGSLASPA
ncbi:hypothetical protein MKX01_001332 [Papaver californicum]|nr:hypothetical protein MKX01_001332 [Papaver californicum]